VDAVLRGMARFRVLNTCLYPGFRADLADRAEARIPLSSLFSTTGSGANPTLSATLATASVAGASGLKLHVCTVIIGDE